MVTLNRNLRTRAGAATCALFSLLLLSYANAQEAPAPATAVEAKAASPSAALNPAEQGLVGVWVSMDTSRGAAAGIMTLRGDRSARLEIFPIANMIELPAMEGTWRADEKDIHLDMGNRGSSSFAYELTPDTQGFEASYANGMAQLFFKDTQASTNGNRADSAKAAKDVLP